VRAEEDRLPTLGRLGDAVAELPLHEGVQATGRLVQHEQWRPGGERRDQRHLLPVAGGVGAGPFVGIEFEAGDQLVAVGDVRAGSDAGEQVQALAPGEAGPQRDVGGDVGEVLVGALHVGGRHPEDLRRAAGGAQQPEQHADGRRLAGAVGTEEAEDLTARHRERQVVDGEGRLEPLREALGAYGRRGVGVGGVGDGGHSKPPGQPGTRLPTRLPGTPPRNLAPPDHRRKVPPGMPPREVVLV
jgi:hypothetical protein